MKFVPTHVVIGNAEEDEDVMHYFKIGSLVMYRGIPFSQAASGELGIFRGKGSGPGYNLQQELMMKFVRPYVQGVDPEPEKGEVV